jgi:hypothetical protein
MTEAKKEASKSHSIPEVLKAIDGIITALEKFPKTKQGKLPDSIVLGIGKLNGAITKLTTYVEEK